MPSFQSDQPDPTQTFQVTAPDGTIYEVQAPAGASEAEVFQQVEAYSQAPRMSPEDAQAYVDLTADPRSTAADIIGFLKGRGLGADPQVVQDFVRKRNAAKNPQVVGGARYQLPAVPARPANTLREDIRGGAASFLEGALPGSAKAARGAREVVLNALRSPFTDENFEPAAAYGKGEQDIERVQAEFEDEHPSLSTGLQVGGFATGALTLPTAKVFQGGRLAAGVGNGVLTGAGYGGLSGVLNDTGDGRLANATDGVLFGGAVGAAAPVVVGKVADTVSTARRNVPGLNGVLTAAENLPRRLTGREPLPLNRTANAQAERILGREMHHSTIETGTGTAGPTASPQAVQAEVARRQALGVLAIPADTSEGLRGALSAATSGRGRMASRARGVLSARQAQQGQRIRSHIAEELGPQVDPIAEAEAITQRAREAAGPAYQQAYAQGPMAITPDLSAIMARPAFRDALPQAYRNIQNRGGNPEAIGFTLAPDGSVTLSQAPSFEAFDQVVRTLDKRIKLSDLTGPPILDNESGGVNDVLRSLDGHLKASNGAYRAAKVDFADDIAVKGALNQGQDIARLTGPEIAAQLRTMPQHAQEAWMAGGRTALTDIATKGALKPTANVTQRVRQAIGLSGAGNAALGDPVKLQAIETMSGRPGVLSRLDDRLEAEDQAYRTFQAASSGPSGDPFAHDGFGGAIGVLSAARKAARGNLAGAAMGALFQGNPRGTMRFRQDVQNRVAELLTATQPRTIQDAMQAISRRAETDDAFRASLHRAGAKATQMTALPAAAQDARAAPWDEYPEE